MTTNHNILTAEEADRTAARVAMRLRAILDAARFAALHEGEEEAAPFDADQMHALLGVAVDELDKLSDAMFAIGQAHRAAITAAGGAA